MPEFRPHQVKKPEIKKRPPIGRIKRITLSARKKLGNMAARIRGAMHRDGRL